jgi:hypothetical protein
MVEVKGVDPRQPFLGKEFALLDRYELQDALVETLKDTKYRYRVESVAQCHRMFRGRTCRGGHSWAKAAKSCGLRLCPHCCRQRATEVAARLQPFLAQKPENSLRYMVLTDVNCADLDEGRELIFAAFARLRRSKQWKDNVKGCVTAFEATYNPRCDCGLRKSEHHARGQAWACDFEEAVEQINPWHPHLNVLAEGEYFPHEELAQLWEWATDGRAKVVHISAVTCGFVDLEEGGMSKAARELVKYITKPSDLVGRPVAMEQFLDAVYGRRLLRTYGTFYGLKLEEDVEGKAEVCPDCGTDEWVDTGFIVPQRVGMDSRGVLRDKRRKSEIDRDVGEAVLFAPKLPREKAIVDAKVFSQMRKSFEERGLSFDERHGEWQGAVERVSTMKVNVIAGWGYSEWLAKKAAHVS